MKLQIQRCVAVAAVLLSFATNVGVTTCLHAATAEDADKLAASILGVKLRADDGKIIVSHVKRGGIADRAGVRPGDQLQSIEKHQVSSLDDVAKILQYVKPGDGVVMTVVPTAKPRQLYLSHPVPRPAAAPAGGGMLGATLNDSAGGIVVGQLSMGGPAVVAGIRSGDRIISCDGKPVRTTADLLRIIRATNPGTRVDLGMQRTGWQRTLAVTLGAADRVAALPKMTVPPLTDNSSPTAASVDQSDRSDEWADEKEVEDIYNVNDRALYTDFD